MYSGCVVLYMKPDAAVWCEFVVAMAGTRIMSLVNILSICYIRQGRGFIFV